MSTRHTSFSKKKKVFKKPEPIGIQEPPRKSLYQVIQNNFKVADRTTYIHRLIYIGEHKFRGEEISELYERVVKEVNHQYNEEPLTGFILYYPTYFCVCIDGCEDSIHKHLEYIFGNPEIEENFGRTKCLVAYHHIGQRLLNNWMSFTSRPATLLEKIDFNMGIEKTYVNVMTCIQRMYRLGIFLRPKASVSEIDEETSDNESGYMSRPLSRTASFEMMKQRYSRAGTIDTLLYCLLPEYDLLEFLLSSQYTQNLMTYFKAYGNIMPFDTYDMKIWPTAKEIVPFDVFLQPRDPVIDFPKRSEESPEVEEEIDA